MASLDDIVNVRVSLNTTAVSRANYGTVMILGQFPGSFGDDVVRTYNTAAQASADGVTGALLKAVQAVFAQDPKPRQVKIGKTAAIVPTEDELAMLVAKDVDWYGLVLSESNEEAIEFVSNWAESNKRMFIARVDGNTDDGVRIANALKDKQRFRTAVIACTDGDHADAAWMAKCFNYAPGSESWANKRLAGVTPLTITVTQKNKLFAENANAIQWHANNIAVVTPGKMAAGEWIDVIRFRDWLENTIQANLVQFMLNTPKIPYTGAGLAQIRANIRASLYEGVDAGGISPTETTESGDVIPGFTVESTPINMVPATHKAERIAFFKFHARLSGAIHVVEINGSFDYQ